MHYRCAASCKAHPVLDGGRAFYPLGARKPNWPCSVTPKGDLDGKPVPRNRKRGLVFFPAMQFLTLAPRQYPTGPSPRRDLLLNTILGRKENERCLLI